MQIEAPVRDAETGAEYLKLYRSGSGAKSLPGLQLANAARFDLAQTFATFAIPAAGDPESGSGSAIYLDDAFWRSIKGC